jgi:ABC-type sugar transport system ATPase subunit
MEVADRIEVMRLGQRVGSFVTKEVTAAQVVGAITGTLGRNQGGKSEK